MSTINSYFKSTTSEATGQKAIKATNNVNDTTTEATIPWVEKYRPKNVDEVVCQDEVVAVLKRCVQGADLPNILFYGPPGTGKTSAAVALCHQLFKTSKIYKNRVLEMNASDERGIDVIRNRIKEFARLAVSNSKTSKDALIPLKIVILDEADAMTGAAQSALRRTMENETHSTRFFLICNYITRIIEPLTSRCAKFRFKPLSSEAQKQRLLVISEAEKVKITNEAITQLVSISGGDLRKSITLLQSMACSGKEIDVNDVNEMSGRIPDKDINLIVEAATSTNNAKIPQFVKDIVRKGYSANQILTQLADAILENDILQSKYKAKIFQKLGEIEKRLLEGANDYIQILDLILTLHTCLIESTD